MSPQEEHLNDEQFGNLLTGGQPSSAAASHLEICELCRRELQSVGVGVQELSVASSQWAETTARRRVVTLTRWERAVGGRVPWAAGLSVTALAGLLAFGLSLHEHTLAAPVRPVVAAAAPSSSALADDNRLLLSISQELNYQAETPTLAAGSQQTQQGSHTTHSVALVN